MELINRILKKIKKSYVQIGTKKLYLDLKNPHEKKYKESIKNDDYFIAKKFIKKGYKVLDLGANIGFTALLYLKFGASIVFAFEPVPALANRIRSLKDERIVVAEVAISDVIGSSSIFLSSSHNQGHSLNKDWPKHFKQVFFKTLTTQVKTSTLDNYFKDELFDFIKIDVEGLETNVVSGGTEFFKRNQNAIVQIEIYDWQFASTHDLLKAYYEYLYVPILDSKKVLSLIMINSLKEKQKLNLQGAPNYLYSNSLL